MSVSLSQLLYDGQAYMRIWPKDKRLNNYFSDGLVIAGTQWAIRFAPPSAVLAASALLQINGAEYSAQAITVALFFISLPVQGILWLGHRSNQRLPLNLQQWYLNLYEKLQKHGCDMQNLKKKANYGALALLLNISFKQTDKAFKDDLF